MIRNTVKRGTLKLLYQIEEKFSHFMLFLSVMSKNLRRIKRETRKKEMTVEIEKLLTFMSLCKNHILQSLWQVYLFQKFLSMF